MTRETARQVFGLVVRLAGLALLCVQVVPGLLVALSTLSVFWWWLCSLVVAWFLICRADVVVQLAYPEPGDPRIEAAPNPTDSA